MGKRAEHTPGPWVVVENDGAYVKEDGLASLRIEGGPHELVVALVVSDIAALNHEANARLIAAAPDLLAFARHVASIFDDAKHPGSVESVCRDKALALIASATGEA